MTEGTLGMGFRERELEKVDDYARGNHVGSD